MERGGVLTAKKSAALPLRSHFIKQKKGGAERGACSGPGLQVEPERLFLKRHPCRFDFQVVDARTQAAEPEAARSARGAAAPGGHGGRVHPQHAAGRGGAAGHRLRGNRRAQPAHRVRVRLRLHAVYVRTAADPTPFMTSLPNGINLSHHLFFLKRVRW